MENINKSFNFLLSEIKRLKLKEKNKNITKEEKETLLKLISFVGQETNE